MPKERFFLKRGEERNNKEGKKFKIRDGEKKERKKDLQRRYLFCRHVVLLIPAMCLCHPFYAAQSALSSPCHLPHTHPQMESIYFLFSRRNHIICIFISAGLARACWSLRLIRLRYRKYPTVGLGHGLRQEDRAITPTFLHQRHDDDNAFPCCLPWLEADGINITSFKFLIFQAVVLKVGGPRPTRSLSLSLV